MFMYIYFFFIVHICKYLNYKTKAHNALTKFVVVKVI